MTAEAQLGDDYKKCIAAKELDDDIPICSDNTILYLFTCMQYITCCLCFSISKPFRRPIYTNPLFLISVIIMTTYQIYLILFLDSYSEWLFDLL